MSDQVDKIAGFFLYAVTRFHGVLAHNSKHRINVTPAKRGKESNAQEVKSKKSSEPPVDVQKEMT